MNKKLFKKLLLGFDIPHTLDSSLDITKPVITADIILALEQVILDKYGSIQYFMYDDSSTSTWSCGTDFYWESNKYEKSGPTRVDSLFFLLLERRLDDIKEKVQQVFAQIEE